MKLKMPCKAATISRERSKNPKGFLHKISGLPSQMFICENLEINYGLLGVDDLEKSKRDNKTRILDMLHRGKELGFPVLFSSHQQELSETQRIQEAKEETKQ